jgi:hypothetical protein
MKTCSHCNEIKALDQFYKSKESKDGLYRHCKACQTLKYKKWAQNNRGRVNSLAARSKRKHRDTRLSYLNKYYIKNQEKARSYGLSHYRKVRSAVIEHYGGVCRCCGESQREFLCIDHVNNNGYQHRREIKATRIAGWLKRNNYPDGFQVLCANCNLGKRINGGVCPHVATRAKAG